MKKHFIYTIILFFVLANQFAFAQKQTPPAGGTPKNFVLPQKQQRKLQNGMGITMVQYGTTPKVNVNLIIKTGNVHEAANQVWLADLLANMMNQGTTSLSATALAKKVAGMGGEISIYSGSDQFYISGSALSEYAPELVKLIADVVINPALPSSEIERLKTDLKRRLAVQKGIPQSIAQEKFFAVMYGDHPYGRIYPTEEMLNSYQLNDVKDFYNKNFGAKRSVLYVAGKYDASAVTKAIDQSFKSWKEGPAVNYPSAQPNTAGDTTIINRANAPQTTVMMGLPVLTPKDKDYVAFGIMNAILGGSFASRITSNIRENKGYTYSPFSTVLNHPGTPSVWYEVADITSEHTIDAVNEIRKEVSRLQSEAPSKDELQGIQRYAAGIFVLQNSSRTGIINQLNFIDLYGLSDSYLSNYVKNIYAVTSQQVSDLTKEYIKPAAMALIMVGDEASIKQQNTKASK